ncbi:hypothetical protein [Halococcus sp. PRR34]|uniref:hypothetical protein n=1 Tax=Halococcus sp. PRR34 TaxID=3020830 RepID=UPI002360ACC7|nr:hypothetical protein [Halococcus sp. PRR34]
MVDSKPDPENLAETSRISLSIEGVDLPTDKDDRQDALDRIIGKVEEAIEEENLSPDSIQADSGYQYPKITAQCPRCEHMLQVREGPEVDGELSDRLYASVRCSHCGYTGGVSFDLTDIQTNKYNSDIMAEEYRSEVQDMNITPEYHSY